MKKKNLKNRLRQYQKEATKWYKIMKNHCYHDERNTVIKFVVPLLEILGWRPKSKDMEFEYTLRRKNRKRPIRVDIALYGHDSKKPSILVEVKCLQDDLGSGRYLLRYLSAGKIPYGIYTNGRELKLVDRRTPTSYNPEGLFSIKLEDFIKYKKVLFGLSRKALENGKLKKLAKSCHTKKFWNYIKKHEKNTSKYYLRLAHAEKKL